MNLQAEVRTKIAAQPPLKLSRQLIGDDRTILVCDGVETFYSGDGRSYYKGQARVTPQCDFPLSKFYDLAYNWASISVVGRDHVRLADGDRPCVVVRAALNQGTATAIRSMCIDPTRPLILRDVIESTDQGTGITAVKTTTFSDFESDPTFPPDTFRFSVPPGAVEAKPPI